MGYADDHFLLILSDSQLPIGSFAYSSGLESISIHGRNVDVSDFLLHSIASMARTSAPFLAAAFTNSARATEWDDILDANMPCQIARRASTSQGRALLKLLEKTFLQHCRDEDEQVYGAVRQYRRDVLDVTSPGNGHFAVVFGLAGRVLGIDLDRLLYAFLQSHAKAVLSAAVRLSLIGPYESTHLLASRETRGMLERAVKESRDLTMEESGQTFSLIDIWQGRHELLYSRIFSA